MLRALFICLMVALLVGSCSDDGDKPADTGTSADAPEIKPDTLGVDEPFGRVCTNLNTKCKEKDLFNYDLFCVATKNFPTGKGFCTRKCSDVGTECDGAPNGQMANCSIQEDTGDAGTQGQKYCLFLCKTPKGNYTCPGTQVCGPTDGQGFAACKAKP